MEASLPTASAGAAAPDGRATAGDDPLIFIVSGPGGVGKGTIVKVLVERDPVLWLSRSWTTREQRPGEADDAYVFTSRDAFEHRIGIGGFLEWTDFLGNYYGTPMPEPTPGRDTVLDEQARRLRGRGDPDHKVDQRVRKAEEEEPIGRALADHIVVNDDLARTVDEMLSIIQHHRSRRGSGPAIR